MSTQIIQPDDDLVLNETDVRQKIESHAFRVERMLEVARNFDVSSKEEAGTAMQMAVSARDLFKSIEEARKEIVEPARKFTNRINDTARIFTEKLQEIQSVITQKVDFWKRQEAEAQKQREMEAAMLSASLGVDTTPYVVENTASLKAEGASSYEKTVWKFDLQDIASVPAEFLTLNTRMIEGCIKAGMRDIPGIRIYSEKQTIFLSR